MSVWQAISVAIAATAWATALLLIAHRIGTLEKRIRRLERPQP